MPQSTSCRECRPIAPANSSLPSDATQGTDVGRAFDHWHPTQGSPDGTRTHCALPPLLPLIQPSHSARPAHTGASGTTTLTRLPIAMPRRPSTPSACAPATSPARYMKVSMKAFALYLSSRSTTVNSTSRTGRVMPRCTARLATSSSTSTTNEPYTASPHDQVFTRLCVPHRHARSLRIHYTRQRSSAHAQKVILSRYGSIRMLRVTSSDAHSARIQVGVRALPTSPG